MDIKEIQNLIKFVAKSGASEVKLETEDLKITIRTGPLGAAVSEPVYMQQMPMAVCTVRGKYVFKVSSKRLQLG